MDPNEALKNARKWAAVILNETDETEGRVIVEAAHELADAFEALDGWLSKGGFRPEPWVPR